MSKTYKNKTCIYCGAVSTTGDHVVPRSFFLERDRQNLPQVPACSACNDKKSRLEHYLGAVMPFGARHSTAGIALQVQVPKRLEKNKALAAQLDRSLEESLKEVVAGTRPPDEVSLAIDPLKVLDLARYIAKGLAFFHWQVLLDADDRCESLFPSRDGMALLDRFFQSKRTNQIAKNLGRDTFLYEGRQDPLNPKFTIWRMSLYGTVFGGVTDQPNERPRLIHAITCSKTHELACAMLTRLFK